MIINFFDAEIIFHPGRDPVDQSHDETRFAPMTRLPKEKWTILSAIIKPVADTNDLTDVHFLSKITARIKLYCNDEVWMIPLSNLVGSCFVLIMENVTYASITELRTLSSQ